MKRNARFEQPGIVAAFVVTLIVCTLVSAQSTVVAKDRVDVLIGFKNKPGANQRALVRGLGGKIKYSYTLVPAIAASIPEAAIPALFKNRGVANIELDGTVQASDIELDSAAGVKQIGAGAVHANGNTGAGIKVAVIDSGVDFNHPELTLRYAGGYDFVNGDSIPLDDNGHGTHVAGTIAGEDNGVGVVGVAPGARIYALKVLDANGSGSFSNVIAALQWCVDNGIQVTNNSYGSSINPGGTLQAAFDAADAAGMLNIAAAGNSGNPKGKGNKVGYPARYGSVVAVAAVDGNGKRASFSSTGDTVEIAAPGVSIYSTLPGGGYGNASGTSMACPHVVGTAALVLASGITGPDAIRLILASTAQDLGDSGLDPLYGWGLVDAAAAVDAPEPPPGEDPPPEGEDPPPPSTSEFVEVESITYATEGGKNSNKHLLVTVNLVDETGAPVAGASISLQLIHDSGTTWSGGGITGAGGSITLTLKNAPAGGYTTDITNVSADGLPWDESTPENSFVK